MPKSQPIPKPTPAELDLLRTLWRIGPATAKQVCDHLLAEKPDTNSATVLRQLQVMHAKGLLGRDESSRSHVYAPIQSRDKLQSNLLKDLINRAFSGSGKALVMAALRSHVTEEERAEIERFLQEEGK